MKFVEHDLYFHKGQQGASDGCPLGCPTLEEPRVARRHCVVRKIGERRAVILHLDRRVGQDLDIAGIGG